MVFWRLEWAGGGLVFLAFWSFSEVNLTFTSHVVAWSSRGWSPGGGLGHLGPVLFFSMANLTAPSESLIFKKIQNIRISKNVRFSEFFWISEFFSDFQNISDFLNFFKFLGFQKLPDFQFFKYLSEGQFHNNFT